MVPTLNGYLELHSCELLIIGALFLGVIIAFPLAYSLGKDNRYYRLRDAKGKFVKRQAIIIPRKQTWEPEEAK